MDQSARLCATDPAWRVADAELGQRIRRLFERCPELCGFSVQPKVFAEAPVGAEEELFVTAISIAPRLGKEQYAEIFEQIASTLNELLGERAEAHTLLRGRTFARAVH